MAMAFVKYYKSNSQLDMQAPLGVINFDQFNCTVEHKINTNKFKILVAGIERKFKFQTISSCLRLSIDI